MHFFEGLWKKQSANFYARRQRRSWKNVHDSDACTEQELQKCIEIFAELLQVQFLADDAPVRSNCLKLNNIPTDWMLSLARDAHHDRNLTWKSWRYAICVLRLGAIIASVPKPFVCWQIEDSCWGLIPH